MSLFQCAKCGCRENTAVSAQGFVLCADSFLWDGLEQYKGQRLCSACGPAFFRNGKPTKFGKWHGVFDRKFLPKGSS